MQRLRMFWIVLVLGLVACETAVIGTPTPFPTEVALVPLTVTSEQPVALEIADLIATPEASQNSLIRLTGQYHRRPKLVCENDPHPGPATWELGAGEDVALAGGFDNELRRLLPDGLTMTVEGHWLLWHGPVGCGKRAEVKDIWYLQVNRIVDPSPITQVTLTPFIAGIEIAVVGTPDPDNPVTPGIINTPTQPVTTTVATPTEPSNEEIPEGQATEPPNEEPPVATPEGQATELPNEEPTKPPDEAPTPSNEEPTKPPDGQPTATPTVGELPPATPTRDVTQPTETPATGPTNTPDPQVPTPPNGATVTPTPTLAGTASPTATLDPSVPTNTPTPVTPTNTPDPNATATLTPTPTPTGEARLTIQEQIDAGSLTKHRLETSEIHAWPFFVSTNEVVTVTAVTSADTNLVLSIVSEDGMTLAEDDAPSGEVVTIGPLNVTPPGPYLVHVEAEDGIPADYVLIMLFSDSLNFIFQPLIDYGASETIDLPATSEHFWHFVGNAGDQIHVTADPDDDTDVFLELYGTNADRISAPFISVGPNGVTEQLDFTLPEDGLYSIRVGEWNFAAGSYLLTLSQN